MQVTSAWPAPRRKLHVPLAPTSRTPDLQHASTARRGITALEMYLLCSVLWEAHARWEPSTHALQTHTRWHRQTRAPIAWPTQTPRRIPASVPAPGCMWPLRTEG